MNGVTQNGRLAHYLRDTPELKEEHKNSFDAQLAYAYYLLDLQVDDLRLAADSAEPGDVLTEEEATELYKKYHARADALQEICGELSWAMIDHSEEDYNETDFYTDTDRETIRECGGYYP